MTWNGSLLLSLLDDLRGKRVLVLGRSKTDQHGSVLDALDAAGADVDVATTPLEAHTLVSALVVRPYDVLIVKDAHCRSEAIRALRTLPRDARSRLTVVVIFEPGLRPAAKRLLDLRQIAELIRAEDGNLDSHVYHASPDHTELACGAANSAAIAGGAPETAGIVARIKRRCRGTVRRLCRSTDPSSALFVVIRQRDAGLLHRELMQALAPQARTDADAPLDLVLQARAGERQMIFGYRGPEHRLETVVKAARGAESRISLRRERDAMRAAESDDPSSVLAVPEIVSFHDDPTFSTMRVSPARGQLLYSMMRSYRAAHDLEPLLASLERLTVELSLRLTPCGSRLPTLDRSYADDVGGAGDLLDAVPFDCPQHGDFAAVNLFYDRDARRWTAIDWEWAAAAYPPLFDLFTLIASLGYLDGQFGAARTYDPRDICPSLISTFCGGDLVANAFRRTIFRVALTLGVERRQIFPAYIGFLTVYANRYQSWYRNTEYADQYRRALDHALRSSALRAALSAEERPLLAAGGWQTPWDRREHLPSRLAASVMRMWPICALPLVRNVGSPASSSY